MNPNQNKTSTAGREELMLIPSGCFRLIILWRCLIFYVSKNQLYQDKSEKHSESVAGYINFPVSFSEINFHISAVFNLELEIRGEKIPLYIILRFH